MKPIALIGPSYQLDTREGSVQRTVNLMPVPLEPGNERTGWVLKDVPGLVAFEVGGACNCNVDAATLTEQGTAYATSLYSKRSPRISADGLALVVPIKTSDSSFSGSMTVYDRVSNNWTLASTTSGIGTNDGTDPIIAAFSASPTDRALVVLNQSGTWTSGLTNVLGFRQSAPGNSFLPSNDGFYIAGAVLDGGVFDPQNKYCAVVLAANGNSLYLMGINGATNAWVLDRYTWVNPGWVYSATDTPWGAQVSTLFSHASVISGDNTHIAIRRQSATADGVSILTQVSGAWVESFTYAGVTPSGYTAPLSLGSDGACMLVAEAATSAGPFTVWLTTRGASTYTRTEQLPGSFVDVPLHASDLYNMILFADEATPDVETFTTDIVCS